MCVCVCVLIAHRALDAWLEHEISLHTTTLHSQARTRRRTRCARLYKFHSHSTRSLPPPLTSAASKATVFVISWRAIFGTRNSLHGHHMVWCEECTGFYRIRTRNYGSNSLLRYITKQASLLTSCDLGTCFSSSAAQRQALFSKMVHRNASKLFVPAPTKSAKVPIN